jgi:hypothetical protein
MNFNEQLIAIGINPTDYNNLRYDADIAYLNDKIFEWKRINDVIKLTVELIVIFTDKLAKANLNTVPTIEINKVKKLLNDEIKKSVNFAKKGERLALQIKTLYNKLLEKRSR